MQSLVPVTTRDSATKDTAGTIAPELLLSVQRAWLDAANQLIRQPWSGDVTQWIRAWGEAIGQVGLVNVNYAGSRDIQAERRITGRYSYGSQLGRVIEVLAPYVKQHEKAFGEQNARAVREFLAMADEIGNLKQATVEDLLDKVEQWKKGGNFALNLQRLREGLKRLDASD